MYGSNMGKDFNMFCLKKKKVKEEEKWSRQWLLIAALYVYTSLIPLPIRFEVLVLFIARLALYWLSVTRLRLKVELL
jgi:hypothetical protein